MLVHTNLFKIFNIHYGKSNFCL